MTKALKKAFEAAAPLSESAQDEVATAILAEIEAEERFDAAIQSSPGKLESLADEALTEHRADRTESLGFKRVHATKPIYSVRIGLGHRALGVFEEDVVLWFWIGHTGTTSGCYGSCDTPARRVRRPPLLSLGSGA